MTRTWRQLRLLALVWLALSVVCLLALVDVESASVAPDRTPWPDRCCERTAIRTLDTRQRAIAAAVDDLAVVLRALDRVAQESA